MRLKLKSYNDDKRGKCGCKSSAMAVVRLPSSVVVVCVTTVLFLLYLLPWHSLLSVQIPLPSPSSSGPRDEINGALFHPILFSVTAATANKMIISASASERETEVPGLVPYRAIHNSNIGFNTSRSDVLVILHIQKTGGTSFEKHIVQDLVMEQPCICWKRKKRCKCPRPTPSSSSSSNSNSNNNPNPNAIIKNPNTLVSNKRNSEPWLFSRFSTGWICGLHADWTELTACVDSELDKAHGSPIKRRYFYVTMIRDPIHRFLSEFRHVQRGATWKASRHICNGRYATAQELGSCYSGRSWTGVSLSEFLNCPHNLAFNRQTRMLADLSLVGCYNKSYMPLEERNRVLLASAKRNLESMAFVGLTEYQKMSQYIFEETFQLRFKIPFTQKDEDTYSKATLDKASAEELEAVRRVNSLDLELYAYAEQLIHSRFQELKRRDSNFDEHYNYLGEEKGHHFSWDEVENEK